MKKVILCLIMLFTFSLNAQAAIKPIPEGSMLRAKFTQNRYLKDIEEPITSKGEMNLWSGKGLIWTTKTPFPSSILITQQGMYQLEGAQKIAMASAGNDNIIFDILGGDFSHEVNGFKVENLKDEKGKCRVRLVATHSEIQNFIKSIEIEGKDKISRIVINRPNGDMDDIVLKDHVIIKNITPQQQALFDD